MKILKFIQITLPLDQVRPEVEKAKILLKKYINLIRLQELEKGL